MKRQVIISGDFTITEVSSVQNAETVKVAPVVHKPLRHSSALMLYVPLAFVLTISSPWAII